MKIWQVDSFTNEPFRGNPAGVMILDEPLNESLMQSIAFEMNLSETAFVDLSKETPVIHFFTPAAEVDLCGHATLAAAHIYLTETYPEKNEVVFATKQAGLLTVNKHSAGYTMHFPLRPGEKIPLERIPSFILKAISDEMPIEAYQARDLMLVYENEATIRNAKPNFEALKQFKKWIAITSAAKDYDFISRFFCSDEGILEDPVTGSAHCTLGPYWCQKLAKKKLNAFQASKRGGELQLEVEEDSIKITGQAVTVLEGTLKL
jgi:PhzF family phenazine biosynthesis protein